MKTMPTFSLFDLKDEKQQEFPQVLNDMLNIYGTSIATTMNYATINGLVGFISEFRITIGKNIPSMKKMITRIKDEKELFKAI